jgi:hypothetical protein
MEIDGIPNIQLRINFVLAWLESQFNFFNFKKNRKTYFISESKTQYTIKGQILTVIGWFHRVFLVKFFEKYGLKLAKIVLVDSSIIVDKIRVEFFTKLERTEFDKKTKIYRAKEMNNMSDRTYQDFINEGCDFGSLRFAKKCRSILNGQFRYKTNASGVYNLPEEKMKYYLKLHKDKLDIKDNTIHIRLAGDGTNIGKNYSALNFSFSFLNKHENLRLNPNCVTGVFILGMFKIKENYESLKSALKDLLVLIKNCQEVEIDGVKYKIEYWLGGDMKFLLLVLGNYFS